MVADHPHPIPELKFQLGEIDWTETRIIILRNLEEQQQKVTLWHEILHGIAETEGLKEGQISRLSSGIYGVLKDNDLLAQGWWEKIIDEEEREELVDDHTAVGEID